MLTTNFTPVTESYFGKTKTLIEAEKVVRDIIKEFKMKGLGKRIVTAAEINKSPLNRKLEALLQEQFGFGELKIHWLGAPTVSMFGTTNGIVKLINSKMPKLPIQANNGGYYDSSHNYLCVIGIYCGILDVGVTADQVMAFILHEIGHQFNCAPLSTLVSILDYVMIPVEMLHLVNSVKGMRDKYREMMAQANLTASLMDRDLLAAINQYGEDVARNMGPNVYTNEARDSFFATVWACSSLLFRVDKNIRVAGQVIQNANHVLSQGDAPKERRAELKMYDKFVLNHRKDIESMWKNRLAEYDKESMEIKTDAIEWSLVRKIISMLFTTILTPKILRIHHFMDMLGGYANETFADSFATAYGYGPSLTAGINIIHKQQLRMPAFDENNEKNVFNQYLYVIWCCLNVICDPHPMDQTRITSQIDGLRKELKSKDIDPKVAKQISKDLDKCEKVYKEYLKVPDDQRHLTIIYNIIQLNDLYFNGKMEIRSFINYVLNVGKDRA